jgi:hypothetical protein
VVEGCRCQLEVRFLQLLGESGRTATNATVKRVSNSAEIQMEYLHETGLEHSHIYQTVTTVERT